MNTRNPPSTAGTDVIIESTYALVDTFLLPQDVSFSVRNVASFALRFTRCTVTRQSANP